MLSLGVLGLSSELGRHLIEAGAHVLHAAREDAGKQKPDDLSQRLERAIKDPDFLMIPYVDAVEIANKRVGRVLPQHYNLITTENDTRVRASWSLGPQSPDFPAAIALMRFKAEIMQLADQFIDQHISQTRLNEINTAFWKAKMEGATEEQQRLAAELQTEHDRQLRENGMTEEAIAKGVLQLLQPMLPQYQAVPEFGPLWSEVQKRAGLSLAV